MEKMRAEVFVPGHITGFFEIAEHGDDLKTGSRGCGIVIDKGVRTEVAVKEGESTGEGGCLSIETYINGKPFECPVTKTALKSIVKGGYRIEVFHRLDVPMSQGFGASGAGTLGAVIGINKILDLKMGEEQCGKVAHVAEVKNKTGLGDVIAEMTGGIVMRKKPGAPGIGEVERIGKAREISDSSGPSDSYVVSFTAGREIQTSAVITDQKTKKRINAIGNICLNEILKSPTEENFLRLSKIFAYRSKLMSKEVNSVIKELEKRGIESSMIMLGNSVFTLTDEPEMVAEHLEYLGYQGIVSKIDYNGPRIWR